jgi:hypothetical protein
MIDNNKDAWKRLPWKEKVQICQQGIAHEDTLLLTFIVIFIGLEALFFTVVVTDKLGKCVDIAIAAIGILVAIRFVHIFVKAGNAIDRWGMMLHDLWDELNGQYLCKSGVKASEFVELHKPSVKRREIGRKKCGCWKIVFGWWVMSCSEFKCKYRKEKSKCEKIKLIFRFVTGCFPTLKSRRRMMTTCTPFLVIFAWALIICQILDP